MKLLAALATLLVLVSAEKVRYDNYRVYRLTPKDYKAVEALKQLEDAGIAEYSFWTSVVGVGAAADVMVAPAEFDELEEMVAGLDIDSTVMIENVQTLIDNEGFRPASRAGVFDFDSYHTVEEYNDFLRSLVVRFPSTVTLIQAGWSYEGRPILGVKVSFSPANANNGIFLESNMHAREWIAGAVNAYILNELLTSHDPAVRHLAETHDWYIFPIANPDGYVFSYTSTRMWRKTRVPYSMLGITCFGADPNRNWPFRWNTGGSSSLACSDTYMGPSPWSEPSTRGLGEFISTIAPSLVGYISIHSYSQMLLLPYGHTSAQLDNYNETYAIGVSAARSLARRYGTQYTIGNIPELLYVASGSSMDWVKGNFGTPIAYTYELRDTGRFGFLLPAEQIRPTGEETLDSLVTIFEEYDKIRNAN
ncbi:hypothetical protein NQ318_019429 [Aromia moschata]|uniref:Zinc carboxypeptidase A 1 n=1 Tax=Aromia moschata TaxID=1265417 RepID=A0AAV8Y0U7_9CUCU|nr:hypothetical protein NQ318_019429 [Aromia moschata]